MNWDVPFKSTRNYIIAFLLVVGRYVKHRSGSRTQCFAMGTQDTAKVWIPFSEAEKREFMTSQSQVQPGIK